MTILHAKGLEAARDAIADLDLRRCSDYEVAEAANRAYLDAASRSIPPVAPATDDLIARLRIKADMITMGEKITWGSDSALMYEAASALSATNADMARKLAELDGECQQSMLDICRERERAEAAEQQVKELRASEQVTREALTEARRREVQALHAGLSRRDWHAAEGAADQLRDKIDAALSASPGPSIREPE